MDMSARTLRRPVQGLCDLYVVRTRVHLGAAMAERDRERRGARPDKDGGGQLVATARTVRTLERAATRSRSAP